jgi:hypothetical protein
LLDALDEFSLGDARSLRRGRRASLQALIGLRNQASGIRAVSGISQALGLRQP